MLRALQGLGDIFLVVLFVNLAYVVAVLDLLFNAVVVLHLTLDVVLLLFPLLFSLFCCCC